jgi:hypothetical protein
VLDLRESLASTSSPEPIKLRAVRLCGALGSTGLDHQSLVLPRPGNTFKTHGHSCRLLVLNRPLLTTGKSPHLSSTPRTAPSGSVSPIPRGIATVEMFKRNKPPARSSTPTTPKIKSIALPSFGGRGYESDSLTKSTSPLKRASVVDKRTKAATSSRSVTSSKMRDVFTVPDKSVPLQREPSLSESKLMRTRTRSDSMTSGRLPLVRLLRIYVDLIGSDQCLRNRHQHPGAGPSRPKSGGLIFPGVSPPRRPQSSYFSGEDY